MMLLQGYIYYIEIIVFPHPPFSDRLFFPTFSTAKKVKKQENRETYEKLQNFDSFSGKYLKENRETHGKF